VKARHVAKGFSQVFGKDYRQTYAPVCLISSLRILLAIAAILGLFLENMDVDTAFLQSPVEEEIYVKQPQGFEQYGKNGEELVCRLKKSLYGLKQAPRNWNKVIDEWLISYGFTPSKADPCVYVYNKDGVFIVIVLYVDDLVIAGNNKAAINDFKTAISKRFKMKDLGALKWILGMEIKHDMVQKKLEISQTAYIDKVLEKFGMKDCNTVGTPAVGHLIRDPDGSFNEEYSSAVGSILWAAMVSKPELSFAAQRLGRHLQSNGPEHWTAVKRVFRYMKSIRDKSLIYHGGDSLEVKPICFCDADHGEDLDTRRSTTAYVVMLAGGAVSWASRLQPTVALSSTEAEYMATCAAVQEMVYLRQLFADLGFEQKEPTIIHQDNQACIALAGNPIYHKRTKHIDIRYHYVRERVENGDVALVHVPSERQLADLLTKPLAKQRLAILRDIITGYVKYEDAFE